ncbi:mCG1038507 [Mus musculus]|nr:mCG1038507 [Mus musculus]
MNILLPLTRFYVQARSSLPSLLTHLLQTGLQSWGFPSNNCLWDGALETPRRSWKKTSEGNKRTPGQDYNRNGGAEQKCFSMATVCAFTFIVVGFF